MNYNYLLYFSVLAQTEHYTTAAARLGISQPALSSAIHNLENSLGGVRLFEKVGRNIRLTEEGRFYQQPLTRRSPNFTAHRCYCAIAAAKRLSLSVWVWSQAPWMVSLPGKW